MVSTLLRYPKTIWSHNPIPGGCLLYLPLWNNGLWGSTFKSIDPYGHVCTRTGGVMSGDGFTADGDDFINCGALFNSLATLWISVWFRFTATFNTGEGAAQFLFGKVDDAQNYFDARFDNTDGKLKWRNVVLAESRFAVASAETSWAAGVWQHAHFSLSAANGVRMIVNNGTAVTNADKRAIPADGDFILGDRTDPGTGIGLEGTIGEVIVGTNNLTTAEEAYIYNQTKGRHS